MKYMARNLIGTYACGHLHRTPQQAARCAKELNKQRMSEKESKFAVFNDAPVPKRIPMAGL